MRHRKAFAVHTAQPDRVAAFQLDGGMGQNFDGLAAADYRRIAPRKVVQGGTPIHRLFDTGMGAADARRRAHNPGLPRIAPKGQRPSASELSQLPGDVAPFCGRRDRGRGEKTRRCNLQWCNLQRRRWHRERFARGPAQPDHIARLQPRKLAFMKRVDRLTPPLDTGRQAAAVPQAQAARMIAEDGRMVPADVRIGADEFRLARVPAHREAGPRRQSVDLVVEGRSSFGGHRRLGRCLARPGLERNLGRLTLH